MLNTFRGARAVCAAVGAAALLLAWGCKPVGAPDAGMAPSSPDAQGVSFLRPPQGSAARRLTGGVVEVAGSAPPGATITLRSPDGQSLSATSAGDGGWSVRVPPAAEPRLYALAGSVGGRALKSEGALAISPAPAAAALALRAGAPARTFSNADGSLSLEAVDFDSGGLAVAGLADPRAGLRLSLDGRPAAAGQADAAGRFALLAVQGDLKPGVHRLTLDDGARAVEVQLDATPAAPSSQPYAARRTPGGWRIDWATPGGGVQSSVVLSPPPTRGR